MLIMLSVIQIFAVCILSTGKNRLLYEIKFFHFLCYINLKLLTLIVAGKIMSNIVRFSLKYAIQEVRKSTPRIQEQLILKDICSFSRLFIT